MCTNHSSAIIIVCRITIAPAILICRVNILLTRFSSIRLEGFVSLPLMVVDVVDGLQDVRVEYVGLRLLRSLHMEREVFLYLYTLNCTINLYVVPSALTEYSRVATRNSTNWFRKTEYTVLG